MKALTFISALFIILSINTSFAQTEVSPSNSNLYWFKFNSGIVTNKVDNHTLFGVNIGLSYSINVDQHKVTIRANYSDTEKMIVEAGVGGFWWGTWFSGSHVKYIRSNFTEGAFMYGLITNPSRVRFHASSGISVVSGSVEHERFLIY